MQVLSSPFAHSPSTSDTTPDSSTYLLERSGAQPLHEQISDHLHRQLRKDVQPGDQIPTEDELTRRYGVSRSTIRKAIERLVSEHVLTRHRGKGTYLARALPQIVHPIDRLAPFMETFKQLGDDIRVEVSGFAWIESDKRPEGLSGWQTPELTWQWQYFSRDVPHAITRTRVPRQIGNQLTQDDITRYPVYELLQRKLQIKLEQSKFTVSCRPPTAQEAQALGMNQSVFALVLDRITLDDSGTPVEMTTHVLRPDVYQLSVSLNNHIDSRA